MNIDMLKLYKNNSVIRPLMQLIPLGIGSVADVVIMQQIEKLGEERIVLLENELKSLRKVIDSREYSEEYILSLYLKVSEQVVRTQQREKIKLLALTLVNLDQVKNDLDYDFYEFGVNVLCEMSLIEIQLLSIVFEQRGIAGINRSATPSWRNMVDVAVEKLRVTPGEVKAISNVLEGKGLIVDMAEGLFSSSSHVHDTGRVSELGSRVIKQVTHRQAHE